MTTTTPTHAELVQALDPWGREQDYPFSLTEPRHRAVPEEPDRWFASWDGIRTAVAEVKVSRGDRAKDFQKPHRQRPGLGKQKWLVCPEGLIEPHEIDDQSGWGQLWWRLRTEHFEVVKEAPVWRVVNHEAEKALLLQCIRNLQKQSGTSAQEARPSQKNRVPEKYHGLIRGALISCGPQTARWMVNYALPDWEPNGSKISKTMRLAKYAMANGIDGVTTDTVGGVTYLRLTTEGEG